jgi:capsular polysaccharide biosynthesis protein
MIGTDGLVVHRGQVIGDTLRHLTVGENAPAIAAILPDRLVLKPTLAKEATVWDGAYFCGFSGGWQDYTVWLVATLPRLIAYKQLRRQHADVRLVLPRFTGGAFQNETLSLLGIEPTEIMVIGDNDKLKFAELFVTSAFDLWAMSPYGREAAHQLAAAALAGRMTPRDAPERLYVFSALSRETMINFNRVVTLLSQYGFHCTSLDDLSLHEQIAIMQRARFVVGDHGPALANLLFAQRGTRALELFRPRDPQPLYWSVASISGQEYGFVVGHPASAADNARHGSVELFEMPISVLQEAIQALLSGVS